MGSGGTHGAARHLSGGGGGHDARRRHVATLRVVARPVVGIPTPVEHAAWARVWEMDAAVVAMSYVEAVQRAGGVATLLPPDAHLVAHPDEALDHLDALLLAGGADLAPETYGARAPPAHGEPARAARRVRARARVRRTRARHAGARRVPRHAGPQRRARRDAAPARPRAHRPRGPPADPGHVRRPRRPTGRPVRSPLARPAVFGSRRSPTTTRPSTGSATACR